jgi:uncharacterized protein (TIGR03086 family)
VRKDLIPALAIANADFRDTLAAIGPHDLDKPTPCREWNVGRLVQHVVEANLWVGQLLTTGSSDEATITATTSEELAQDWEQSATLTMQGFELGLERVVSHPLGLVPAGRLVFFRLLDTLVHAWDLRTALGAPTDLDVYAVEICLNVIEPISLMLPGTGLYGLPVPVGSTAGSQVQLLAILGRSA